MNSRHCEPQNKFGAEAVRLACLIGVTLWLFAPFFTSSLVGGGDALWYTEALADFVSQCRAGNFPVFVGQTVFQFNGSVYPLRVAPLYQHLGGALDAVTAHHLGFYGLQHATVIVCALSASILCYIALRSYAPRHPTSALVISLCFISCPGVLGIIYSQDLYMSWMTLPGLPLAMWGTLRSFRRDDLLSQALLAGGLAILWYAHAPIAMWMTLCVGIIQVVRLSAIHRSRGAWGRALLGGGVCCVLASYPFISLHEIRTQTSQTEVERRMEGIARIPEVIHQTFPANLLPVSKNAMLLSDLQLGYTLWGVLVLAILVFLLRKAGGLVALPLCALALLLLLFPWPVFCDWWWTTGIPNAMQRLTYYWPMQRLYPIAAVIISFSGQAAWSYIAYSSKHVRQVTSCAAMAGLFWTLSQAANFREAGYTRTSPAAASELKLYPENLLLMNHPYGLLGPLPSIFSNGVVAPSEELELLNEDLLPSPGEQKNVLVSDGKLEGRLDANPGITDFNPTFTLLPNKVYQLEFDFSTDSFSGILQLVGKRVFREYVLPHSGGLHAFGAGLANKHSITIWTSGPAAELLQVRFIPTGSSVNYNLNPLRGFRFYEVKPEFSNVQLLSLMPLRAAVTSKTSGWLQTPRMFLPGYKAWVNDVPAPVIASPENLAAVKIPEGSSRVMLEFEPSHLLLFSFWAEVLLWTMWLAALAALVYGSLVKSGDTVTISRARPE